MAVTFRSSKRHGGVIPTGNKQITISSPGTVSNIDVSEYATASVVTSGLIGIDHLTINSNPNVTTYVQGDTLNLTGLSVSAVLSDGASANVTNYVTTSPASGSTLETIGTNTITVSYYGKTATFNVIVEELGGNDEFDDEFDDGF